MNLHRSVSSFIKISALFAFCLAQNAYAQSVLPGGCVLRDKAYDSGVELVYLMTDTLTYIGEGSLFAHIKEIADRAILITTDIQSHHSQSKAQNEKDLSKFIKGLKSRFDKISFDDLAKKARFTPKQTQVVWDIFTFVHGILRRLSTLEPHEIYGHLNSMSPAAMLLAQKLQNDLAEEIATFEKLNDRKLSKQCSEQDAYKAGQELVKLCVDTVCATGKGTLFENLYPLAIRFLQFKATSAAISRSDVYEEIRDEKYGFSRGFKSKIPEKFRAFLNGIKHELDLLSLGSIIETARFTERQAYFIKEFYTFVSKHVNNLVALKSEDFDAYKKAHDNEVQMFAKNVKQFCKEEFRHAEWAEILTSIRFR